MDGEGFYLIFYAVHVSMQIGKNENNMPQSKTKSQELQLLAFLAFWGEGSLYLGLTTNILSVHPLANVVGSYTCHNG